MRLGDKGCLQFMFPSERYFKRSFGRMAEMIESLPLGLYFLSLSDSMHIVICACEKVRECLICIRRVEVILKKSSHRKLCVQSKETLSHTWWGPVRTMVAIIHLINRHSLIDHPGEGNGNPLQYSCLQNPMDWEAWWATVHGVAESWTRLSVYHFTSLITCFVSTSI